MDTTISHYKVTTLSIIGSGTLICFVNIGVSLVALPLYLGVEQGLSTTTVGLVISLQYFSTLICRPAAGRISDIMGAKQCVITGALFCCLSGAATSGGFFINRSIIAMSLISLGRITLGCGQAMIGTGTLAWSIGIAGKDRMSEVISWNGMASYSAMALGALAGSIMITRFGYISVGIFTVITSSVSTTICTCLQAAPIHLGERTSFFKVFAHILPFGLALSLSNVGYGVLVSFITLYYRSHGWSHAEWGLSVFSVSFVCIRLVFSGAVRSYGGFIVALVSLTVESIGLITICVSNSPWVTLGGAAIAGAGISLIFTALGVEALREVADPNRASALGAYSLCQDLSVGMTGPVAGLIAASSGFSSIFGLASLCSFLGIILVLKLSYDIRARYTSLDIE